MTPEMASLLLRQHSALVDEGIGPHTGDAGDDTDRAILEAAWLLVNTFGVEPQRFTAHWGYENGLVDKGVHATDCTCSSARVDRGEIFFCRSCATFQAVDGEHVCRAERAIRWFSDVR